MSERTFWEAGLPDGWGALGVGQDRVSDVRWVVHIKVPEVSLANLILQGKHPLGRVHAEK